MSSEPPRRGDQATHSRSAEDLTPQELREKMFGPIWDGFSRGSSFVQSWFSRKDSSPQSTRRSRTSRSAVPTHELNQSATTDTAQWQYDGDPYTALRRGLLEPAQGVRYGSRFNSSSVSEFVSKVKSGISSSASRIHHFPRKLTGGRRGRGKKGGSSRWPDQDSVSRSDHPLTTAALSEKSHETRVPARTRQPTTHRQS